MNEKIEGKEQKKEIQMTQNYNWMSFFTRLPNINLLMLVKLWENRWSCTLLKYMHLSFKFFCILLCFYILKSLQAERLLLPRLALRTKGLPGSTSFTYKPANSKSVAPTTSLSNSHTPINYSLCPKIIPGPATRQLEATSVAQSPLELFRLANPKLFTLPYLASSKQTLIKTLA